QPFSTCRMARGFSPMTPRLFYPQFARRLVRGRCGILRSMSRASAFLYIVSIAVLMAGCATAPAVDPSANAIVVTGTGKVSVAPDTALLTLGVESQAATLAEATADAAPRMTARVAGVKAPRVAAPR